MHTFADVYCKFAEFHNFILQFAAQLHWCAFPRYGFCFAGSPKLYVPSTLNTEIDIVLLLFWGQVGSQAVLKMSAILLKYSIFDFFHILMDKTSTTFFVHCSVYPRILINFKWENCQCSKWSTTPLWWWGFPQCLPFSFR